MKIKINLIILFFLFSYCLYAEYSDSITETEFSEADSIVISREVGIVIDKFIGEPENYRFVLKNVIINEDSVVVYVNWEIISETAIITSETIQVELGVLYGKNLLRVIVLNKESDVIFDYEDTLYYNESEFTEADSIVISRKANIVLIDENKYTSDKINYNFVFKNVWLNEDSFVMYLNNNIIVETTTITNDTIEVELSFENTINLIKIIVLDKNNNILLDYNDTLYYITETNYSLTDSIVIKGIIKDIIMFNYLRIKQILYNDNEIFNYNNWINISNKKNDMYYREPNMNYLKYKRL